MILIFLRDVTEGDFKRIAPLVMPLLTLVDGSCSSQQGSEQSGTPAQIGTPALDTLNESSVSSNEGMIYFINYLLFRYEDIILMNVSVSFNL